MQHVEAKALLTNNTHPSTLALRFFARLLIKRNSTGHPFIQLINAAVM